MSQDLRIDYVPLSEIEGWPRNPKLHDEDALDDSIERFGYVNPITPDEKTGRLVAGHGRLAALRRRKDAGEVPPARIEVDEKTGEWLVPVLRGVSFDSEAEAEAYILADNRLTEAGGWDVNALTEMLGELNETVGLDGVGWTDAQVEELLALHDVGDTDPELGPDPDLGDWEADEADLKQIVVYLNAEEYAKALERMAVIMRDEGLEDHTELFLHLLDDHEGFKAEEAAAQE